jgi:transposase, IS6 family
MATRTATFKWWQTEPELILCAVRWYLRYSLSLLDVEELLDKRGLQADHTTVWRWVQRYAPEMETRLRRHLKPTNKSWRVDETYIPVEGRWCYLYRAIDSTGATIDFLLSVLRDANAAKHLFRKALADRSHSQRRVINTDHARIYGSAMPGTKEEGTLRHRCRHRPVQFLNNILEQDHRAIKRRVNAKQGFREFQAARRTMQESEAMQMMRKGQVRWLRGDDLHGQIRFLHKAAELRLWGPASSAPAPTSRLPPITWLRSACRSPCQSTRRRSLVPPADSAAGPPQCH